MILSYGYTDRRQKRLIFSTVTSKMNLSDEVGAVDRLYLGSYTCHLPRLISRTLWLARIKSALLTSHLSARLVLCCGVYDWICIFLSDWCISLTLQEAGMQAVRKNRYLILAKDFETGMH